jgi:hypothetical protein
LPELSEVGANDLYPSPRTVLARALWWKLLGEVPAANANGLERRIAEAYRNEIVPCIRAAFAGKKNVQREGDIAWRGITAAPTQPEKEGYQRNERSEDEESHDTHRDTRPNDIKSRGERKRVRWNEGLDVGSPRE